MITNQRLIFITLASITFFIFSGPIFSQSTEDVLREVLSEGKTSVAEEEEGYTSFTQNEIKTTVSQLREIDDQIERDLFRSKLIQDRVELASKLCSKDQRACFLIDEYKQYKWAADTNSEPELFGLDIFSGYPLSFDNNEESSLGNNYALRVGDKLRIFITGMRNVDTEVEVRNSGEIVIPSFGPVSVVGLSLDQANLAAQKFVASKDIGSEIYISLSQVRANQAYVLGLVNNPGSYLLNSLSSPINGIISSGGFNKNASLRNIEVFRNGTKINSVDLYDLVIFGNSRDEKLIESGDVILVGSVKNTVTILGEVLRPAIYEIKQGDTFQDILRFSLGLTTFANKQNIAIKRLDPLGNYRLLNINYQSEIALERGDIIEVSKQDGILEGSVYLFGDIKSRGGYEYKEGLNLANLININTDILNTTYLPYALIKRYDQDTRGWSYLSFNLFSQSDLEQVSLFNRDEIFIFSNDEINFINSSLLKSYILSKQNLRNNQLLSSSISTDKSGISFKDVGKNNACLDYFDRQQNNLIVDNILKKLSIFGSDRQGECSTLLNLYPELSPLIYAASIPVLGNVLNPGLYPIAPGVNRYQILSVAGGVLTQSDETVIEAGIDQRFEKTLLTFVNVKLTDIIQNQGYVTLSGEFNNPGIYPFKEGDNILNIIKRAGGFTKQAYPIGGIFTRESLKEEEQNLINRATNEISEILSNAVASGYLQQSSTDLVALVELMSNLENTKPLGRMVVELNPAILEKNPQLSIPLQSGDSIYLPSISNTINVSGQVMNPIVLMYDNRLDFMDYVNRAGGVRDSGDIENAFALLPNGETIKLKRGLFGIMDKFSNDILPGTVIYVPRKQRPLDSLALVETISPIVASLSVTAASIAAISNNN